VCTSQPPATLPCVHLSNCTCNCYQGLASSPEASCRTNYTSHESDQTCNTQAKPYLFVRPPDPGAVDTDPGDLGSQGSTIKPRTPLTPAGARARNAEQKDCHRSAPKAQPPGQMLGTRGTAGAPATQHASRAGAAPCDAVPVEAPGVVHGGPRVADDLGWLVLPDVCMEAESSRCSRGAASELCQLLQADWAAAGAFVEGGGRLDVHSC